MREICSRLSPIKAYFVLNGTSAANKVVTNALLTRDGDLVLFDRNNRLSRIIMAR